MQFDPVLHHRCSIRLPGYDYTQAGAYFVTICTYGKLALYGEIVSGKVRTNLLGNIVSHYWLSLPHHFPNVKLDEWVLMPNHLHGIIILCEYEGRGEAFAVREESISQTNLANASPLPSPHGTDKGSLAAIVGNFKSVSSRRLNITRHTPGGAVWQRNYFEHIILSEESLNHIREYITNNPAQWESDSENPNNSR